MSTLATRLSLSMVGVAAVTALVIGVGVERRVRRVLEPTELAQEREVAQRLARGFVSHVEGLRSDVVLLREAAPLAAYLRTLGQGEPAAHASAEITHLFESLLLAHPQYLQARLIGRGDQGRELIRVERTAFGRPVRVVPGDQLQAKGDRPYLVATLETPPGEIYISPIELNQEFGRVVEPRVLVIRAGAPVLDDAGQTVAALVVNVDLNEALAEVRRTAPTGSEALLIDEAGNFILHPTPEREPRSMGPVHAGLLKAFSSLLAAEAGAPPVSRHLRDPDGRDWATAAVPIQVSGGPRLVLISRTPSAWANALTGARRGALEIGLMAVLAAALLAFLMARSITRPLAEMSAAASGFLHNQTPILPTDRKGEIGVLARAFEAMNATIRERSAFLAQQELRFRRVVEATPSALLIADRTGAVVLANPQAERLCGAPEGELLGRALASLVPAEQRGVVEDLMRSANQQPSAEAKVAPLKSTWSRPEGRARSVELTLTALQLSDGSGILMSVQDTTERDLAEEHFRLVVEGAPYAMLMVNRSGTITLVNRRAEALFGYQRSELLGAPIGRLIPPQLGEIHDAHLRGYFANPSLRSMGKRRDLTGLSKSGREVPVEIGLDILETSAGLQTLAAIVDITERKRFADELARSNAELEQFAYVASHDLQEPLRMVASFTELLGQRYRGQLDEKADKYIFYAVDGAKRMQLLISDLLAYSRVGSQGKPLTPVPVSPVLTRVLKVLSRVIETSQATIHCGPLPTILADEVQLSQLFQNLIGNALKFRAEAPPEVRISAELKADLWEFRVQDNGVGLDMQFADRIFQMFQRLQDRAAYEGSGIGLSIAKRIVERHGGRIWVQSAPGRGTTFYFTLQPAPGAGYEAAL